MKTYYVGMDVHRASIVRVVLNRAGKVVMQSVIETGAERVRGFRSRRQPRQVGPRSVGAKVRPLKESYISAHFAKILLVLCAFSEYSASQLAMLTGFARKDGTVDDDSHGRNSEETVYSQHQRSLD